MSVLDAPVTAAAPAAPTTGLTPIFVRLKLTLLRNGLRQSTGRRTAFIVSPACWPRCSSRPP
ncbi:Transporter (Fragment) OS=Streptomyces microflavus OX=1919 GN=G3I39_15090 PE=4 SV=1 [Streptomyces microflavus]